MIIRSIRLTNFALYAGQQCIEPATALDGKGPLTLVGGLNGRGKTSLLEAVLLNLYGDRSPAAREQKSYTSYLENLIHKGADRNEGSAVELELEVPGEGETHTLLRVRRSWHVANKRASERLDVWRNGIEDPHLASNWSKYVEDLVPSGVSWLFFFDGEKIAALAEEEETSDSLRIAIRSLLGLDLVDKLIADLNAIIKRNRAKLREAEGAEAVNRIEAELESLRSTTEVLRQERANKNNEVLKAQDLVRKLEDNYVRTGGTLAESRAALEKREAELRAKLEEKRKSISQMAAGALPLLLVSPLLPQLDTAVQAAEQVRQARAILPLIQRRDNTLLTKLAEHFPDFNKLDVIAKFLETDRGDLEAMASRDLPIQLSAVGQMQLNSLLHAGGDDLRERAERLAEECHGLEEDLVQIHRHLLFQYDQDLMTDSLTALSKAAVDLDVKKHQRDQLDRQIKEVDGQSALAEQSHKSAIERYAKNLDTLDEANRTISVALRSQETMRAFRQAVTERKIHALEAAVTAAFHELTHKAGLVSEIRIHPDTLQITPHVGTGEEVLKSRLSSGEKQMLAVSILWGLARASGRDLPVIIDTPMGRLDSSHRMNFVTRYLPNASHQVIVLSTDTEIVGPYLDSLNGAIGSRYLLRYDEASVRTTVEPGYFPTEEGATA